MKNAHFVLTLCFAFAMNTLTFSQQHSSCPKVLDESIQLFQSDFSNVTCEYDAYGKCINSFSRLPLLSEQLYFFDTRFRTNGVELIWQSKNNYSNEDFIILRSNDGEQFHKIGKVSSADYGYGQISFLDNLPLLGNNHYMLKKVNGRKTMLSNEQSVYVSIGLCHLETMNIKIEKDDVKAQYYIDNSGIFQLLVTDTEGHEYSRKDVVLKTGKNNIEFSLPINGIYFVTLTNGFTSVTDLFVQSQGTADQKSTVADSRNED